MSFFVRLTKENINNSNNSTVILTGIDLFTMLTALRSSPALLNRVLPVLYFDRNLLIPDILNSIKLFFISNGCQGIRICTLFFEKKSEVWEKIVLEQVRSKFLRTFFKPPF